MTRTLRLLATFVAALVVSAAASASAGMGRAPRPASAAPAPRVMEAAASPLPPAGGAGVLAKVTPPGKGAKKPGSDYALDRIPVASRVITLLKDRYLDPSRFKPKEMLVAALKRVERKVAEVLVQGDAKGNKLTLTVGAASRDLDISDVTSIWHIRPKLGEALGFVQEHLVAQQDLREIEYAAVNGMLSTLDPHTILLDPKNAREMKVQIRGEFGGVGFVIGMRNNALTVVRVLKNTPAQRAGIKAKDTILRIDDQSTANLDLQEAVDRLRGVPKTKVAITLQRPGAEPRRVHVERDIINIETVNEALLPGDVGYVRLSSFSGHTARDLSRALRSMAAQRGGRLSGIVLDLRANPGGLLDQAVQVSDLFLSSGEIVKQVGHAERDTVNVQDLKEAHAESSDIVNVPLVVIVDSNSASASEIVAGALKNNNRALVIGRQTFGKGSVQQLQEVAEPEPDEPDPPELKFTIAQYLTPGDLSIQETGVTPDVLMVPGRALKEQINVFAPPRTTREADLEHHLVNAALEGAGGEATRKAPPAEKPSLELRYLLDEKDDPLARQLRKEANGDAGPELTPEQQEDEDADADPDAFVKDYRIRFAAELLRRNPAASDRPRLLEAARALVAERSEEEASKLERRMKELGVDWAAAAHAPGTPRAVVTVSPPASREQKAGELMSWTVTVENKGDAPFRRLRAWTSCDFFLFDRKEFAFGAIPPGEKRSWTVPVRIPKGLDTRRDEVQLHFEDEAGKAPADVSTAVALVEVPRPAFAFSMAVDDRQGGNGDGLLQRGESFHVRIDVRNTGTGLSGEKTYVLLKSEGDDRLVVAKGREVLGAMKPGEVKSVSMQAELRRGPGDTLPLRVVVGDEKTFQSVTDALQVPIAGNGPPPTLVKGVARVRAAQTLLRGGASATAPVLGVVQQGAAFPLEARAGDFYRVTWNGRAGFLAAADVSTGVGKRRAGPVSEVWQHDPPRVTLSPDPAKGAPVVETDTIKISGVATLPSSVDPGARIRDVFVYANEQKVFFKVMPDDAAASRLEFSADVPLQPGNNTITVFARESEDLQSMRSIVVYRKPPPAVATEGARGKPEERKNAQP